MWKILERRFNFDPCFMDAHCIQFLSAVLVSPTSGMPLLLSVDCSDWLSIHMSEEISVKDWVVLYFTAPNTDLRLLTVLPPSDRRLAWELWTRDFEVSTNQINGQLDTPSNTSLSFSPSLSLSLSLYMSVCVCVCMHMLLCVCACYNVCVCVCVLNPSCAGLSLALSLSLSLLIRFHCPAVIWAGNRISAGHMIKNTHHDEKLY